MKKVVLILFFVMIIMLTGCTKKQELLVCTSTQKQNGLDVMTKTVMAFSNNKVTRMLMINEATIDEKYIGFSNMIKTSLEKQNENYKNNGATVEINVKGTKVTSRVDIDITKLTSIQKSNLAIDGISNSLSQNKQRFEKLGYTCK